MYAEGGNMGIYGGSRAMQGVCMVVQVVTWIFMVKICMCSVVLPVFPWWSHGSLW